MRGGQQVVCPRCGITHTIHSTRSGTMCADCRTVETEACPRCGIGFTVHGATIHKNRCPNTTPAAPPVPAPAAPLVEQDATDAALVIAVRLAERGVDTHTIAEITGLGVADIGELRWQMHARPDQINEMRAAMDRWTRTATP